MLTTIVERPIFNLKLVRLRYSSGWGASGYGDTIVASNPFDDTPSHPQMGHMGGPGMGMGPMGMNGMGPGHMGMGPMGGMGMGMNPMGPGMNSMNQMGGNIQMGCGIPSPSFNQNMGSKPMPVSAGKVYPVDQPMVFNPQNPNAPPIYPCGICHKEVHDNDQAILCESGCNFWFHRMCTGLTEAAFHLLTAEVYAEWVCDKCLHSKNIPQVKFKP
ncbi:hypothetical protein QYM36_003693 [Artemia franciscana]|uniref:PHD-type domain-containing protein n=1 Tax=Artemia franciscana TaxID=6661 RepID=A0AA88I5B1_ARTSF|nr:hypothetical protein QYM36_003693 [Artemia franciscana]